jgi:mycothiol synthase
VSAIELRELVLDDAQAVTDLLNDHSRALFGEADLDVDEFRHWFAMKNIWMRVAARGDRLVAYLDVADDENDGRRFHIDARPLDEDAAHAVVAAGEAYARDRAAAEAIVRGYAPDADAPARAAYQRAGYAIVRHSFEMRIELDGLPEPEWPEGITVRTFRPADEDGVYDVITDTFADHWDFQPPTAESREQWRHFALESPRFDPELWFLAEEQGELAGISLCEWHRSGDPGFGWVQTLGVRKPWRRRGLALALLERSFAELGRRGATRVGLGVDAENTTGAVRLYRRAGMHARRTTDIYEKQL